MTPPLSVVADNSAEKAKSATDLSERIRRLQAEAKSLAREHVHALERALIEVERLSAEIADGGEAYPAGVRELARRMAEDCEAKVQTLEAISARA
ncbi:hypothetical protein [Phenylobacterium sp.]|jgi:hypothetical protein|uniref:hypothetical protein n=1 Tax=Phenylobacterium sp. TaxID=1871053 RepID=UPI0035B2A683